MMNTMTTTNTICLKAPAIEYPVDEEREDSVNEDDGSSSYHFVPSRGSFVRAGCLVGR
jgi:hypothetical protein